MPTLVLAELYRGRGHNQLVDACLARERASLASRDTDRHLARIVGGVLAGARAGSSMIVDAHAVAVAVEAGGGVVVTGDSTDLERLSGPYHHVAVERIGEPGQRLSDKFPGDNRGGERGETAGQQAG